MNWRRELLGVLVWLAVYLTILSVLILDAMGA
ncbi:MAG: hypothetical protein RIS88_2805 [Pseudomonadota bacterium]|jgi:hypothetical protein